jgi:hypothetical protein
MDEARGARNEGRLRAQTTPPTTRLRSPRHHEDPLMPATPHTPSDAAWEHALACVRNFAAVHGSSDLDAVQRAATTLKEGLGLSEARCGRLVAQLVGQGMFAPIAGPALICGVIVGLLAADYDRPAEGLDFSALLA